MRSGIPNVVHCGQHREEECDEACDTACDPAEGWLVNFCVYGRGGFLAVEGERGGVHETGIGG